MDDLRDRFRTLDTVPAPSLDDLMARAPLPPRPGGTGRRLAAVTLALALATAGLVVAIRAFQGADPSRPAAAGTGEVLVSSALDGDMDLYAMREDGTGLRRLSNLQWHEVGEWSPDGRRIAFTRVEAWNGDVYVMNADGTGVRALTDLESMGLTGGGYDWSPDSSRLLFSASRYGEPTRNCAPPECQNLDEEEIFVIDANGSGMRSIAVGSLPQWSPASSTIIFLRHGSRDGRVMPALYAIEADRSGERRVTPEGVFVSEMSTFSWSPDGSRIAFTETEFPTEACTPFPPDCYKDYVSTAGLDGSGAVRLAEGTDPVWSPDGSRIAFSRGATWSSDPEPGDGLYVMNADGTEVERLAVGRIAYASWAPEGDRILFSLEPPGGGHAQYGPLYIVNVDGTDLRRFVPGGDEKLQECCVTWRPAPEEG